MTKIIPIDMRLLKGIFRKSCIQIKLQIKLLYVPFFLLTLFILLTPLLISAEVVSINKRFLCSYGTIYNKNQKLSLRQSIKLIVKQNKRLERLTSKAKTNTNKKARKRLRKNVRRQKKIVEALTNCVDDNGLTSSNVPNFANPLASKYEIHSLGDNLTMELLEGRTANVNPLLIDDNGAVVAEDGQAVVHWVGAKKNELLVKNHLREYSLFFSKFNSEYYVSLNGKKQPSLFFQGNKIQSYSNRILEVDDIDVIDKDGSFIMTGTFSDGFNSDHSDFLVTPEANLRNVEIDVRSKIEKFCETTYRERVKKLGTINWEYMGVLEARFLSTNTIFTRFECEFEYSDFENQYGSIEFYNFGLVRNNKLIVYTDLEDIAIDGQFSSRFTQVFVTPSGEIYGSQRKKGDKRQFFKIEKKQIKELITISIYNKNDGYLLAANSNDTFLLETDSWINNEGPTAVLYYQGKLNNLTELIEDHTDYNYISTEESISSCGQVTGTVVESYFDIVEERVKQRLRVFRIGPKSCVQN